MTSEETEKAYATIKAAVDDLITQGWQLRPRVTYDPERRLCCPLGALTRDATSNALIQARKLLAAPRGWTIDFADGFDGLTPADIGGVVINADAYQLGRRFRTEYVKEDK